MRLAGPGLAPAEALALAASHGVSVEPHADLDTDPGPADTAYLDVWTPDVAPRVRILRERGARVTSIGDLLLERAEGLTIGITGTAGKTTAASITRQLLLAAGVNVDASTTGRLGNVWPTAELLDRQENDPTRPLLLELTSSHLAFMRESPRIAAVTCFWPDHLELHGSLAAYRAAKETIVRAQRPGDTLVVNVDDAAARAFAELTPAALVEVSLERQVERGVFVRDGTVVIRWDEAETALCRLESLPYAGARRGVVLLAIATAVAAGASPAALPDGLARLDLPAYRGSPVTTGGRPGGGRDRRRHGSHPLQDSRVPWRPSGRQRRPDRRRPRRSRRRPGARNAGGTRAARARLRRNRPQRTARRAVRAGSRPSAAAARRARRRHHSRRRPGGGGGYRLLSISSGRASSGAVTLVFSPVFPVGAADRERFATLVRGRQAGAGR